MSQASISQHFLKENIVTRLLFLPGGSMAYRICGMMPSKKLRLRAVVASRYFVACIGLLYLCVVVHKTLSWGEVGDSHEVRNTRELFLAGGKWVKKTEGPLTPPPGPVYPWWREAPAMDDVNFTFSAEWAEWKKELDPKTDLWVAWWGRTILGHKKWEWSFERPEWLKRWQDGYRQQWRTALPYVEKNGTVWNRTVHSFRVPSMVEADGVLVAIADVRYRSATDYHLTDIVAKYSADGGKTWKTEVIIRNPQVNPVYSRVVDPTVVVKGRKIFLLVGMFCNTYGYWTWHANSSDWDAAMYVGDVEKAVVDGVPTATITWKKLRSFKEEYLSRYEYNVCSNDRWDTDTSWEPTHFLGGVGHGVVTSADLYKETPDGQREKVADKGAIIIPIQIKQSTSKVAATILYSKDDGKTWKFGDGRASITSTESSVVEWKGKLLLNARTDYGSRRVFTSDDMGNIWTECRKLSKVWGNAPLRWAPGSSSSTIKVTIEGRDLMLMTAPKNEKHSHERDRLQLWITDGDRVFLVGQISNGEENGPYSSLMYMKDPKTREDVLYCLHEQDIDDIFSVLSVRLPVHMARIKSVVRTWNEQDKLLAGDCVPGFLTPLSDARGVGMKPCRGVPTAGLIGVLAGGHASVFANASKWRDAFGCVDADIVGGVVANNGRGIRLTDEAAGGVFWPVSEQGQDHRYEAVNSEHSIAVTMVLSGTPTDNIVVMAEKMRISGLVNSTNVTLQVLRDAQGNFALNCVVNESEFFNESCESIAVSRTQPPKPPDPSHVGEREGRGSYGSRFFSWFGFNGSPGLSGDERRYQLTLVMRDTGLAVTNTSEGDGERPWVTLYVNGERVSALERTKTDWLRYPDIQHLHLGGGSGTTVESVLLYNRELSELEVGQLLDNAGKVKLSNHVIESFVSDAFSPINITYAE